MKFDWKIHFLFYDPPKMQVIVLLYVDIFYASSSVKSCITFPYFFFFIPRAVNFRYETHKKEKENVSSPFSRLERYCRQCRSRNGTLLKIEWSFLFCPFFSFYRSIFLIELAHRRPQCNDGTEWTSDVPADIISLLFLYIIDCCAIFFFTVPFIGE